MSDSNQARMRGIERGTLFEPVPEDRSVEPKTGVPIPLDWSGEGDKPSFSGFQLPTSNTTYTPNQFFDVCLPHYSRGVVRLVAYMIRKTLGWCDRDGNPQEENILIPYQDLVEHAGISRGAIRQTIDEAIAGRFIRCVRHGRPNSAGRSAVTALYQLRWDDAGEYLKDPKQFRGFFEGDGHRTDIPNQFFDHLIPRESLGIIRVVGSVIRFSIGFQARRGRRRQAVQISYREVQNYTRIQDRTTLTQAVQQSLLRGYIVRIDAGFFDPNAGRASKAATYALRWFGTTAYTGNGSKTIPEKTPASNGSERFKNHTGNGSKTRPEERFKNHTDIKIKPTNKTYKQQGSETLPAAAAGAFQKLKDAGFDDKTAVKLVTDADPKRVEDQIHWLSQRAPARNPLGMLRRAIEEDWPAPEGESGCTHIAQTAGALFASYFHAGFAGNRSEPTAEPSANEVSTAERYVQRLLTVHADESQIPRWGREFGELCRAKYGNAPPAIVSLVIGLRSHGDFFFEQIRRARSKISAAKRQAAQEDHKRQFTAQWLDYLRMAERDFEHDRTEEYTRFVSEREARMERIRSSPYARLVETACSSVNQADQRLRDFQRFFPAAVLDFWQWDQELNPNRFDDPKLQP